MLISARTRGRRLTNPQLATRSKRMIEYFSSMTDEQRREHGKKSLINRDPINVAAGAKSASRKKALKPERIKIDIEKKRRLGWEKKYYGRSESDKLITSQKCSIASSKRPQMIITLNINGKEVTDQAVIHIANGVKSWGLFEAAKKSDTSKLLKNNNGDTVRYVSHTMMSLLDFQESQSAYQALT